MNINNKLIIALLGSIITLGSGCFDFEQVVEIDIPEHESAITLNALLKDTDEKLQVFVSNSHGILDNDDYAIPSDASVQIFKDDVLLGDLFYNDSSQKYEMLLPSVLESGTYRIEAQYGDYPKVSAEQQMPSLVSITEYDYKAEGTIGPGGERMDLHQITFDDPADEENYYVFGGAESSFYVDFGTTDTIWYDNMLYLDSNNPTVSYSDLGLIVSDQLFNGTTFTIQGTSYSGFRSQIKYYLYNISKDTYLYLKSLDAYYNAEDNPFAEPATVYNNIENGYGIMGLMTQDSVVFTP